MPESNSPTPDRFEAAITTTLQTVGVALVSGGAWAVHPSAGLITAGVLLGAAGICRDLLGGAK